jgi:hypothetical protein
MVPWVGVMERGERGDEEEDGEDEILEIGWDEI